MAIRILRNVADTLHVVIAECNQFDVLLHTDRVRALRQNDHTALNIPAQNNFSWRHVTANFLGNLNDVSILKDGRVRLTEWRVCRYYDTLLAAELNQLVFLVVWMSLDLVKSWDDLCMLKELRECLDAKVAHSDSLDLTWTGLKELFHSLPRVNEIDRVVSHEHVTGLRGLRPVHQVEIDVVNVELSQRLVKGLLNIVVIKVPEFRGNKKVFTRNTRGAQTLTHDFFVLVKRRSVEVGVAVLSGSGNTIDDRLGIIRAVAAKTDHTDLGASVKRLKWGEVIFNHRGVE